jgi:hypothetical protein
LNALKRVVRVFCLVPLITGPLDLVQGIRALRPVGAVIPDRVAADPRANAGLFRLLLSVLCLSGIGRAAAAVQFGRPGRLFTGAMVLELVGAPLLLLWHHVELRKADRS